MYYNSEEKDAYDDGYQAYMDWMHPSDLATTQTIPENPYCSTTQENLWEAWKDGYYVAGWDD